jgi:hypothetical protein
MDNNHEPQTAAELTLYLIAIMPDEARRIELIKDFCRIYAVKEKYPAHTDASPLPGRIFTSGKSERDTI